MSAPRYDENVAEPAYRVASPGYGTVMTAENVISEMVERLVREFDPLKIVLFGSHARGEATRHSDVDLLVVLPLVDDPGDVMEEMLAVLEDLPVPKDVYPIDPDEIEREKDLVGPLVGPALREGKVIYERG